MMTSITWNGKNSYDDFEATIKTYNHGYPTKNNYIMQVPYSSAVIDFTPMQKESYSTRELNYTFNIIDPDIQKLHKKVTAFTNWILQGNSFDPLYDISKQYHFMAKAISCTPKFNHFVCELEVSFIALPYRISENYSNAEWDNFCFETDYLNPAEYTKVENKTTSCHFYNYGINDICPEVEFVPDENSSFDYVVLSNPYSAPITINRNTTKLNGFILKPGANEFALISGAGTIRLKACEEVI